MTSRAECEQALDFLAGDDPEGGEQRRELVAVVYDYIENLERLLSVRGETVKAPSDRTRHREVFARFLDNGAALVLQVPAYDLHWLADLTSRRGDVGLVLRPQEPTGEAWRLVPMTCFVVEGAPVPGDLALTLSVRGLDLEQNAGGGAAHFSVVQLTVVEPAPEAAPTAGGVTARGILEAIEAGRVKAAIRRTPTGIEVHFEDRV